MNKAILFLEDGTSFFGQPLSTQGESAGEVIFNTSMTGYQEVLTDPSYAGQIVAMTYPLIGNYGVNSEDVESKKIHVKGFVVKEFCRTHSNYRATQSLIDYLDQNKIIAIEGIDTRALTRHVRLQGAMKAMISTTDFDSASLSQKLKKTPSMEGSDWVSKVTTKAKYVWREDVIASPEGAKQSDAKRHPEAKPKDLDSSPFGLRMTHEGSPAAPRNDKLYKVAAIDCGIKFNILRILNRLGCEVHVFPAKASVGDLKAINPDGIFVSNGPGDPAATPYVAETVKKFFGKIPVFGICLGHQILGLALGGKTYKMKFGHHGANHPVKNLMDDRIGITSQNHGFCVNMASLNQDDIELVNVNLNDQTLEGIRHKTWPMFSFQHHPEAAPGPHDVEYLFNYFIEMMKGRKT